MIRDVQIMSQFLLAAVSIASLAVMYFMHRRIASTRLQAKDLTRLNELTRKLEATARDLKA